MKNSVFAFLILFIGSTAWAANTTTCGQMTAPVTYDYCITKTDGSTNTSVLYFLHGGGGDVTSWSLMSPAMYAHWATKGTNPPVVVSVSFGPYWLLMEPNGSPNSGLLTAFQGAVIPQMEGLALGQPATDRMLFGNSMGGFNIAQLLAKSPAQTFSRASMVCPAIVDLNPYATTEEILDYALKNNNDPAEYQNLAQIAKAFIPDAATWNTSANPMILTDKVAASQTALMIAYNTGDKTFGPDGAVFAAKVAATKTDTAVAAWNGGHCELDMVAIADFLVP